MAMMGKWRRELFAHLERFDNGELMARIARLMEFEGMRAGFGFGRMAPVLSMHCHEVSRRGLMPVVGALIVDLHQEIYAYLDNVHRRWSRVLGSHVSPVVVDGETVRCLETMAPKHSLHDYETVCDLVDKGRAFSRVTDAKDRRAIKKRLANCDRVLTIHSFFEDMIYARAGFEALRTLLPPLPRRHPDFRLRDGFRHAFVKHSSAFWPSYVSIWLYVLRNFPGLPAGKNGAVRVCKREKASVIASVAMHVELAFVARSLGFDSEEINALIRNSTISRCPEPPPAGSPELSSHRRNVCEHARSNRPCDMTYSSIASGLHPSHVFRKFDQPPGIFVTPFALIRDMVLCFWGEEYERERDNASCLWGPGKHTTHLAGRTDSPRVEMTTLVGRLRSRSPSPQRFMSDDDDTMEEDSADFAARPGRWIQVAKAPQRIGSNDLDGGQRDACMAATPGIDPHGQAARYRSDRPSPTSSSMYSREVDGADKQLTILEAPDRLKPSGGERRGHRPGTEGFSSRSTDNLSAGHLSHGNTQEIRPTPYSRNTSVTDPSLGRMSFVERFEHEQRPVRLTTGMRSVSANSDGAPVSSRMQTENTAVFPRGLGSPVDQKSQGSPPRQGKRTFDAAELHSLGVASRSAIRLTNFPSQLVDGEFSQPPRTIQKQAWDPVQSVVQSLLDLNHKLSSNKIYVASVCDIQAPLQRDPRHQKLWSWREDQRDAFMSFTQRLSNQQALKIVKVSENHSDHEYQTVDASDCWEKLWRSRQSPTRRPAMYPFAVVVENTEERSHKIMRMHAVGGESSVGYSQKSVRPRMG